MAEVTARDAKIIQYLNEAYGKEKQLETALGAHIQMTTRAAYKKRLQQHLRETREHGRQLERRIKSLGGSTDARDLSARGMTEAATAVQNVGRRAAALAQGPLHALRGTGEQEKLLKNAKTEYQDEAEEIATYTSIEALAENVGDSETLKLARAIRREEERMRDFLAKLIPQLTKSVVQAEIPASERRTTRRRRSRARRSATGTRRRSPGATSRRRSSAARSRTRQSGGSSRSRSGATSRSRSSSSPRSRSSSSRSRSSSSRSRSPSGSRSRSSSSRRSSARSS